MLTPYLPFPLHSGGQIRTYNLLKKLAGKHEITLFSFIRQKEEKKYIPELKKYCPRVIVFKRRPAWDFRNILLAGFTPFPFVMISTYMSWHVRQEIEKELKLATYNLIHAEPFYMIQNIPTTSIPILLVEQTIEYLVYKKFTDDFPYFPLKPFLYFDVLKLRFWEEYYWRKAASLISMSKADKEIMQKAAPDKNIDIVANGVDIDYFAKRKFNKYERPTVLFVGNFKWLPNKDAAKFLTYFIWPQIKKEIPQAQLWIVGKNPTREILALGNQEDVIVDGKVEDIRKAFGKSWALLAPIRNGRGTKYKVLEAMAARLPVVTTPLGIEGIKIKKEQGIFVAKNVNNLAKKTIKILMNPKLGKKLARNAFYQIKKEYNWDIISVSLDKIYEKIGKKY